MYGILLEINKIEKSTKYSIHLYICLFECKIYHIIVKHVCMTFHIVNNYHDINLKIIEAKKLKKKLVFIVLMNNFYFPLPL